jgi:hypothetical protein
VERPDGLLVLGAHAQESSSSLHAASAKAATRSAHAAISGSISTSVAPPRRTSVPWLPTYVMEPMETIRRATAACRPLTQATNP